MTSKGTTNAISSRGAAGGRSPSSLPDGADPCGPGAVPVSRFRARDSGRAMPTSDTSGPLFTASSPSARLQWSLESRLRARMPASGSPEYALTWSIWDMPSGPPICRLRARARRTSDSGCGGWPTPAVTNSERGGMVERTEGERRNLQDWALLAGWPTPEAGGFNERDTKWMERRQKQRARRINGNGFGLTLGMASQLAGLPPEALAKGGWATPMAGNDTEGSPKRATNHNSRLQDQVHGASGPASNGCRAPTARQGALNPDMSRWLMGFPPQWSEAAPGAAAWRNWQNLMMGRYYAIRKED